MQITASTASLTVDDVAASQRFFTTHLGYTEQAAAEGFASLTRDDAAVDIVLLARGTEVLPSGQREPDHSVTGRHSARRATTSCQARCACREW